jgi:xanthine dehydrogenase accessory factor
MERAADVLDLVSSLKAQGEAFALATVVRTVAATAAKAGAKAVIRADGSISGGWIGGGCARSAVLNAARQALADGQARLVSVQPAELLEAHGVQPGEEREGVRFARNTCPSLGSMDIFVEPVLPRPQIVLCGSSPVAVAIADLARRLGFAVTACAPQAEQEAYREVDRRIEGYALPVADNGERFVVVSTQGRGDEAALQAALAIDAAYVAFVGSRLKAQTLKAALAQRGVARERLAGLRSPAGLDLGAIGPEEIALSILAEIVALRRTGRVGRPGLRPAASGGHDGSAEQNPGRCQRTEAAQLPKGNQGNRKSRHGSKPEMDRSQVCPSFGKGNAGPDGPEMAPENEHVQR